MAKRSKIEWCDSTFNPWIGCTRVSPACDHCYAAVSTPARVRGVQWGAGQPRSRTSAENWKLPERWNARNFYECIKCGRRGDAEWPICDGCGAHGYQPMAARRRVFCASLADWLDNEVPIEWLADLLDLIRRTPNLDWLLLTKRIGNWRARLISVVSRCTGWDEEPRHELREWLTNWLNGNPPANVWIGATVCNQTEADRDIPKLLQVPARVRFLSVEPMLGPVDLNTEWLTTQLGRYPFRMLPPEHRTRLIDLLDWVICGGESGHKARPMHPGWARSLRDQCAAASVPFLFKQWGEWGPYVNEDHYTHCGAERRAHAWVDGETGENGLCWLIDDDGWWSNFTGDPRAAPGTEKAGEWQIHPAVHVMGWHGKKAAGRLLDGVEHNGFPEVHP